MNIYIYIYVYIHIILYHYSHAIVPLLSYSSMRPQDLDLEKNFPRRASMGGKKSSAFRRRSCFTVNKDWKGLITNLREIFEKKKKKLTSDSTDIFLTLELEMNFFTSQRNPKNAKTLNHVPGQVDTAHDSQLCFALFGSSMQQRGPPQNGHAADIP